MLPTLKSLSRGNNPLLAERIHSLLFSYSVITTWQAIHESILETVFLMPFIHTLKSHVKGTMAC